MSGYLTASLFHDTNHDHTTATSPTQPYVLCRSPHITTSVAFSLLDDIAPIIIILCLSFQMKSSCNTIYSSVVEWGENECRLFKEVFSLNTPHLVKFL